MNFRGSSKTCLENLILTPEFFAQRKHSGGPSKVVISCSRMIRPPVVIGSAMLISAVAWSVGPWRVSVLIILYVHYLDFQFILFFNSYYLIACIVQMIRVLKNRFMSKELQQAIDSVSGALNVLEQKSYSNGSRHPALVNLLVLSTLHQRKLVAHAQRRAETPTWKEGRAAKKQSTRVLNDAARYMRFAACAYGFVVVKGLQILDKVGKENFQEIGVL